MKSIFKHFLAATVLVISLPAFSQSATAMISPVKAVEKASYSLDKLVQKKQINPVFLTDIMTVSISAENNQYILTMLAPSNDVNNTNNLILTLDGAGKLLSFTTRFVGVSPSSPIFKNIGMGEILDLGAEAIVDHLSESADLPVVAKTTQFIQITPETKGPLLQFNLEDKRIYKVQMQNDGKIVSKGF